MGVCVETLKAACALTIDEVANTIYNEMHQMVDPHSAGKAGRTGAASAAIHIESTGEFSKFVGGTGGVGTLHLYWLDEGNGHGRITAKGRALGKYPGGIPGIGWRHSVKTYAGIHFVHAIAARHGG